MGKGAFEFVPAGGAGTDGEKPPKTRKWVRWTDRLKTAFLDHLAATCDVKASAAAIGVDPGSVYHLRRKDAEFSANWATALTLGYEMLETRMIGFALSGGASEAGVSQDAFDFDQGLRMLAINHQKVHGKTGGTGRPGGPRLKRATSEDTDKAILKQLAALDRRLKTGGAA